MTSHPFKKLLALMAFSPLCAQSAPSKFSMLLAEVYLSSKYYVYHPLQCGGPNRIMAVKPRSVLYIHMCTALSRKTTYSLRQRRTVDT